MHEKYLERALVLAGRGEGCARPNPLVGCVIVKNNRIVGEGYHAACGGPHAEINALRKAGKKARGAELYVNLEPCVHWGRTPPCVPEIIKAGIKTVYFSLYDPNPVVHKSGEKQLKKAGIRIQKGILRDKAEYINREYLVNVRDKLPYILLKQALTLDGKIASRTGDSKWISSKQSRDKVHALRANSQAIMVGVNTILKDNPFLTSHGAGNNPARIVIDRNLRIPMNSRFFEKNAERIIVTSDSNKKQKMEIVAGKGVKVLRILPGKDGHLDIKEVLRELYKIGICQIVLESGGNLNSSFFERGLIHEIIFIIAPKLLGGAQAVTPLEGRGISLVRNCRMVENMSIEKIGPDIWVRGLVKV